MLSQLGHRSKRFVKEVPRMRYAYPVVLDPEPDGSAINVSFPDVPGR